MRPDSNRLLDTLERLLELPAADLKTALTQASDLVAAALRADKVDAFLYDPERDSLVAVGTSQQPLSRSQRKHGLDVLPLSNRGRAVGVYQTGKTYLGGRVDEDDDELPGIRETLGVRSNLGVPLEVGGRRRGMMMVASQKPDLFTAEDARFMESVARWVGVVAHRAELMEETARKATEQGRRAAAEELITVFAHDMRNQISPISVRLAMLQRRAEREKAEWAARDLSLGQRALTRLGALVNDILDVARIDRGLLRIALQPVDLAALLEDVAATLSTPENPVQLETEARELIVAADPARVRQCVENLISNAVVHSPRGAAVAVKASLQAAQERTFAKVEIIDQGPGVPPEIAQRIFERYVTGQPGRGLGLGLYLAKSIAELHGGDLTVDAGPRRGGRFILRLPCERGCTR